MPASPNEQALRRARAGRMRRLSTHALALAHPDPRLSTAVENAKRAVVEQLDASAPPAGLIEAFAALVIGDHALARAAIDAWATHHAAAGPAAGPVGAWATARYFGWTGDAGGARTWLPAAVAALQALAGAALATRRDESPAPGDLVPGPSIPELSRDLLALAEALGDAPAAQTLRGLARGADPNRSADGATTGLISPVVRTSLEDLLDGRTDAGIAGWTGLALDPPPGSLPALLAILAAGVLGIDPDADRGRIRMRLHVPAAWPTWSATNIRIGESSLDLRVQRDVRTVEITVEQTAGPLPLTLILEPTVQSAIGDVLVDHAPATLALRPYPDRVVAPVQLVLDAPRILTLTLNR